MVRAMVHSTKHYVQITLSTAATVSSNNETLAIAVERQTANTASEVEEGSTIKAVYFEMWAIGGSADEFFTAIVAKYPGGVAAITFAQLSSLFTWPNKKNIFYTTQGLAKWRVVSIWLTT